MYASTLCRRLHQRRHADLRCVTLARMSEREAKQVIVMRKDLGMRKARYRGRRKTKHQGLMAATVANISRLEVLGALGQTANTALAA